jgi:hypothetical protein
MIINPFVFAQITIPPGTGFEFDGRISIAANGGTTVFDQPFSIGLVVPWWVPEPASGCLAFIALIPLSGTRRGAVFRVERSPP